MESEMHKFDSAEMKEVDVLIAKLRHGRGMLAALDQSGGSTPAALAHYGIAPGDVLGGEQAADLIHKMRVRIVTSRCFAGDRVLGAILFEKTLRGDVHGQSLPAFLLSRQKIASFLKIDHGLESLSDGAQMMKPISGLQETLAWARDLGVIGTKMRSLIHDAKRETVRKVVRQQFALAEQIHASGLVPIVETEVSIALPDDVRAAVELHVRESIEAALEQSSESMHVFLKLTIPVRPGFYAGLMAHPKVHRVFALSGGFTRREACSRLAGNPGMIASFSRALFEDLRVGMSDVEFNETLDRSITEVMDATVEDRDPSSDEANRASLHA
jgi:fructose-bisphosphate aldolase class I